MTQAGPLRWHTGASWLVLAGRAHWQDGETGDIDAAGLAWAAPDRPVAVLPTAGTDRSESESLLDYYGDLGGPEGYIVPVLDHKDAQDPHNGRLLSEAGLIYVADGPDLLRLTRVLRDSLALEALIQAFEAGACVVSVGAGATALGAWVSDPEDPGRSERGLGLLQNMLVESVFPGDDPSEHLRGLLREHEDCLGIGVPAGLALALGPVGEVKTVGEGQVTVVVRQPDIHQA